MLCLVQLIFFVLYSNILNNNQTEHFQSEKYNNFSFDNSNIYYINMDKSKERRSEIENELKKHNLENIIRETAIVGKDLNLDDSRYDVFLKNLRDHFKNTPSQIGHLGCMISHINVFKKFLLSDKDYCIILEDDCRFIVDDFKKSVMEYIKNVPKDWDVILAGYHIDEDWHNDHKNNNKDLKYDNGILNIKQFVGLHCYIINKDSAKILIENLKSPRWIIDWEMSTLCNENKLKVYGMFPPIACQPAVNKIKIKDFKYEFTCNNLHLPSTTNT
tara:strand:- start:672 stop:1490 length:819 start_codon:yes stop_codon:yes gene_type:complete